MKIRHGFVTNSSSSSFLVGFNTRSKLSMAIDLRRHTSLSIKDVFYILRRLKKISDIQEVVLY